MNTPTLRARVSSLLNEATDVYAATPWADRFAAADQAVEGPLRVALAGMVKSGKSTLLNALVGQFVAATDAGECTKVVTEYAYGERQTAYGELVSDAEPVPLGLRTLGGRLEIDLGHRPPEAFARVLVTVPNTELVGLTVIDTPGLSSTTAELDASTRRFLSGELRPGTGPDAVLYLMRQLHSSDTAFLEAFRDPAARGVPPVNALGLLSRADEVGGGRDDALDVAAAMARDYAREPRLRPYVQTVVPVAGLLAECAATLTEREHQDLLALAALPPSVTDALLLTGDRFVSQRRYVPVDSASREHLLNRLGLYGLRWALPVLRRNSAGGRDELCRRLARYCGLDRVRDLLRSQILERRDVLKADAALRLVQQATASAEVPGARRISSLSERLRLGIPDFQELQLLNDLRVGAMDVDDETRERMERLLGAQGREAHRRLGLSPDAPAAGVRAQLLQEHLHWQRISADILLPPEVCRAATVIQRALEQVHRELADPAPPEKSPAEAVAVPVRESRPAWPSPPPAPGSGS